MTIAAYSKIQPHADVKTLLARVEMAFPRLENREYIQSIKSRKNQDSVKESLCALLVLAELAKRAGIDVADLLLYKEDSGKPRFANSEIEFSLSHSHGYAAAVVSNSSRVGIDLEAAETSPEKAEKLAKRFFSESEVQEFETTPESFLRIWTKKESYAKMCGIPLSNLITNEKKTPAKTRENTFFEVFDVNGYPMAVCLETPCEIRSLGEIII